MFSLKFTIFLLFVLFVPLYLRTFQDIEPYPAVLMPAGSFTLKNVNSQVAVQVKRVYAIDKTGSWKKVDADLLIHPIRFQFSKGLLFKYFNVRSDLYRRNELQAISGQLKRLPTARPGAEEIKDLKRWLRTRLVDLGFSPSHIKLVLCSETISTDTGVVVEQKIIYEKVAALDE